jgi:hypothetical protein
VLSIGLLALSPPSEAQQQQPAAAAYTAVPEREYWERVEEYEPWALEDKDAPIAVGRDGGLGGHLLGAGPSTSYN